MNSCVCACVCVCVCVLQGNPLLAITLHPDLVLWCLHADPSAEGHLASLPQLNPICCPKQIKECCLDFYHCLRMSLTIGEFHVCTMWLSLAATRICVGEIPATVVLSLSKCCRVSYVPQVSGRDAPLLCP